jgi:hypothetical protein
MYVSISSVAVVPHRLRAKTRMMCPICQTGSGAPNGGTHSIDRIDRRDYGSPGSTKIKDSFRETLPAITTGRQLPSRVVLDDRWQESRCRIARKKFGRSATFSCQKMREKARLSGMLLEIQIGITERTFSKLRNSQPSPPIRNDSGAEIRSSP